MATININNRTATENLTAGKTYTLSNITYAGYDDIGKAGGNAFDPTTITPGDPATDIAVKLKASGVLKLTVKDSNGDPVDLTSATLTRVSDTTGDTELTVLPAFSTTAIVKDEDQTANVGQCDINFLPWHATNAPEIFIKFVMAGYETVVHTYSLTEQAATARQDFNVNAIVSQVLNFSDAVYTGALPTTAATIDLTL